MFLNHLYCLGKEFLVEGGHGYFRWLYLRLLAEPLLCAPCPFQKIDDALLDGLEQNKDFFTLLLNNNDFKKEVLGIFVDEIYKSFRGDK